jgi:hypothetical protein
MTASVLAMSVAVVLPALLLWAGIGKLVSLSDTASTVSAIGVPAKWGRGAAVAVALWEVGTALGVLWAPGSPWIAASVMALGTVFALAGLVAVLRKQRIRCHCFGAGGAGAWLGPAQIIALPAWISAAAILHHGLPEILPLATGACLLAGVGFAVAALKSVALWHAVGEARGDRLSAREMYVWLPSR